jgi:hypothetical protein
MNQTKTEMMTILPILGRFPKRGNQPTQHQNKKKIKISKGFHHTQTNFSIVPLDRILRIPNIPFKEPKEGESVELSLTNVMQKSFWTHHRFR